MNDLISEFFIDIITRVIPGFIILALYPDKLFNSVFAEFQNAPILLIPGLIGAAWVIGFAIEQASYLVLAWPIRLLPRKNKFRLSLIGDRWQKNSEPEISRREWLKLAGERILFRVLFTISIFTWICSPSLSLLQADRWPLCHHIPIYSLLGALIFGVAWLWVVFPPVNQADQKPAE